MHVILFNCKPKSQSLLLILLIGMSIFIPNQNVNCTSRNNLHETEIDELHFQVSNLIGQRSLKLNNFVTLDGKDNTIIIDVSKLARVLNIKGIGLSLIIDLSIIRIAVMEDSQLGKYSLIIEGDVPGLRIRMEYDYILQGNTPGGGNAPKADYRLIITENITKEKYVLESEIKDTFLISHLDPQSWNLNTNSSRSFQTTSSPTPLTQNNLGNQPNTILLPTNPINIDVNYDNSILIVLDGSGSMGDKSLVEPGKSKLDIAKEAVQLVVSSLRRDNLESRIEIGLISFHGCGGVYIASQFGSNFDDLATQVYNVNAAGSTPLANSIKESADYIWTKAKGKKGKIIIVSDGKETCGGDPIKEAREIIEQSALYHAQANPGMLERVGLISTAYAQDSIVRSIPIEIDVIAYQVSDSSEIRILQQIALAGNGKLYDANSLESLASSVIESIKVFVSPNSIFLILAALGILVIMLLGGGTMFYFFVIRNNEAKG